jgi:UrcA family protein
MKYVAIGTAALCFAAGMLQASEPTADMAPRNDAAQPPTISPGQDGSYTARISIADLDIASAEGAREMQRRVERGIADVCWLRASDPSHKVGELISEVDCRREARVQIREQIAQLTTPVRTRARTASAAVDMKIP